MRKCGAGHRWDTKQWAECPRCYRKPETVEEPRPDYTDEQKDVLIAFLCALIKEHHGGRIILDESGVIDAYESGAVSFVRAAGKACVAVVDPKMEVAVVG